MDKSSKRLWILLGFLAIQVPAWMALITNVPVLSIKYGLPDFAIDSRLNRASMVLRLTGSHVGGSPVGDAHFIDLASGKLSRVSNQEHEATMELDRIRRAKQSMRMAGEGTIEILTHDPASTSELEIQAIDFPKGTGPTFINQRYVLGADAASLFLWDAENPQDGARVYPTPLESSCVFHGIGGSNLAFCLLKTQRPSSETRSQNNRPQGPVGASPFPRDPFSVQTKPQVTRRLLLFRIDGTVGPKMIASWNVLAHESPWFTDVVTRVDDRLVSISSNAKTFEYRSVESGALVDERPLPNGFDPDSTDWAFDDGRIRIGSRHAGRLFDFATNDWLPNPGEGYVLTRQWRQVDIGVYASRADARTSVFDHRRGVTLLNLPDRSGRPEFVDADTLAICSTRCGFGVDVLDLRSGNMLASWTPWWWVPYLLVACLAGYAWWAWAWMTTSSSVHDRPLLDIAVVLGVVVAVFTFRFQWVGTSGVDKSVVDELMRGICCCALALSCCGVFVARGSLIKRVLVFAFVVAGVGAITRFLFDATHERRGDQGLLVLQPTYYETFQAMCFLFIPAFFAVIACWLLMACGFRVSAIGKVSQHVNRLPTWRIADLLLLLAATSALFAVYSSLLPEARSELYELEGNYFFSDHWTQLLATGPIVVAVVMATLARPRMLFWLAGLLVTGTAIYVGWRPISDFVLPTIEMYSEDPTRILATSVAGAFVICLPYRFRGWRISYRYARVTGKLSRALEKPKNVL